MNKKSKLLLTSVGLALLSGIAATGSTFAWFTATRTASLSYSNATVGTTTSNLKIRYLGNAGTFSDPGEPTNVTNLELSGGADITDISGNGLKFVKPIWSATSTIASAIYSVDTAVHNYLEVSISVINDGDSELHVYLGEGTGISPHDQQDAASQKALKAARLAVITGEEDTTVHDQVQFIIVADAADIVHEYLIADSVDADFPLDFGNEEEVDDYIETYENVIYQGGIETKHLISEANAIRATLGVIGANSELKVTFRLWIEGQDSDAVNLAIGGVLDFAANIYALEA